MFVFRKLVVQLVDRASIIYPPPPPSEDFCKMCRTYLILASLDLSRCGGV
jgi:hypothetical protein